MGTTPETDINSKAISASYPRFHTVVNLPRHARGLFVLIDIQYLQFVTGLVKGRIY